MKDENPRQPQPPKPQNQTDEQHGPIKGRQRGEDDFKGRSDLPRGSETDRSTAARNRRG